MASGNGGRQELASRHHVARYCRGRDVDEHGVVKESAFLLRAGEAYVSVNWLEHFHPDDRDIQLAGTRQALRDKGFRMARNGHFGVLNVGAAIVQCRQELDAEIRFINLGDRRDPSHTGIYVLAGDADDIALELAHAVNSAEVYPAG